MFDYFFKNFRNYLIESNLKFKVYLIPGDILEDIFEWYGDKRGESFKYLSGPFNDIEERDKVYYHMFIWDSLHKRLIGGQRFLFNKEFNKKNYKASYLEYYHPGSYNV